MVENPLKNFVVNWCQFSKPQMLLLWIITPTWFFFQVFGLPRYYLLLILINSRWQKKNYYSGSTITLSICTWFLKEKSSLKNFFLKSSWTNLIFSLFQTYLIFTACVVWLYGLWSFQGRDTKLERFLHKNQL